jgi:3-hydroxyacyl-[acyl-carrier protein] dehydratase/trans-2-decenoyl-[acyl-carrier protein] isomerase
MIDRVLEISRDPNRKLIIAEQDIRPDLWFFQCHFIKDPVMPGCLGLDAVWQLLGLYCCWMGAEGAARALGCKEVSFFGQVRPFNQVVRYEITVRKFQSFPSIRTGVVIGNAKVSVDGNPIYEFTEAKVGTFLNINYANYPFSSPHAVGGK